MSDKGIKTSKGFRDLKLPWDLQKIQSAYHDGCWEMMLERIFALCKCYF